MAEREGPNRVERTIDADTVAGMLGVTVATVRRLGREGKLRRYRIGRNLIRYRASDVRRYMSERAGGDGLLSTRDVAELLGVNPQTVRELADSGELPSTKFGEGPESSRRWRFRAEDVEAYLDARGEGPE